MALGHLPQTIGPYEVQQVIGYGGMSTVYRALQPELDRTVAIKVLLPAYLNDNTFRARFQSEARLIARLRHPHIVGIHDVNEADGHPYLVMEYLEGITLHAAIVQRRQQGQVYSPAEALALLKPLANALDYAHSRGVVHRDLKPENVILTPDGPVLTDFGLAKLLQEPPTVSIVMGTPAYMAPEQIESQPIDGRTDVYAMGVMLYELLTGHVPYEGTSPVAVAQAHVSQSIPSLASLAPDLDLPPQVDAIAQRALAKSKEDRWPSTGAMVEALEDALDVAQAAPSERPTVPLVSPPPTAPRRIAPVPRPQHPAKTRRRAWMLLLLVPLIALVLGGIWGWRYMAMGAMTGAGDEARMAPTVAAEMTAPGDEAAITPEATATNVPSPSAAPSPTDIPTRSAEGAGIVVATLEPTDEPTSLPPSTPTPDPRVRGVVRAPTGAFLRSGPGTAYPVIGGLPDRAVVTVLQQAEGWLDIAAETGERGWIAADLFDLSGGDLASVPQGEIPPLPAAQAPPVEQAPPAAPAPAPVAPAPTTPPVVPTEPPPVVPTEPPPAVQPEMALRFEDTDFGGGFRNRGDSIYGGRTATWAYGQGSGYSSMAATFNLDQARSGVARLTIVGMDSEDARKTPLRIAVNGVVLFEDASPFPNDDLPYETGRWAALQLDFDAAILSPGPNTVTITNLARGGVGLPPFVAVDYAIVSLP